jgi:hypothetical protein
MSGIRPAHRPQRTDSRSLAERRHSCALRVEELRAALRQAEACQAELDVAIEADEYVREARRA